MDLLKSRKTYLFVCACCELVCLGYIRVAWYFLCLLLVRSLSVTLIIHVQDAFRGERPHLRFKLSAILDGPCSQSGSEAAGLLRHIHVNDVLGNMCCMYSVLLFILSSSGTLFIWMASDSCLSMHLLLYICVIVIVKLGLCSSCLWCVCMCLSIIELSLFVL